MSAGCNKHRYPIIAYELCEQLLKTLARHAPVKSFNCCCMSCLHREKAEHAEQMACSMAVKRTPQQCQPGAKTWKMISTTCGGRSRVSSTTAGLCLLYCVYLDLCRLSSFIIAPQCSTLGCHRTQCRAKSPALNWMSQIWNHSLETWSRKNVKQQFFAHSDYIPHQCLLTRDLWIRIDIGTGKACDVGTQHPQLTN